MTAPAPQLLLVDGHALAYRHYFAQKHRPLTTRAGEPTSAVYGFSRMIMDILEKDRPAYFAVTFDDGLSGRELIFPAYKAHREAMPADLDTQIGRIQQIVRAFSIPVLTLPGHEADDVIGTVSAQAEAADLTVRVFSGDRDLLQLLSDRLTVRLFIPMAKVPDVLWDVEEFRAKYGLEPHQLIDLKALEGDTSDNIPGVAGVGEKTARTLLQQYPSIEAIYDHIDQIGGAVQKKLIAGRESAFISKDLATIRRGVAVTFDADACRSHDFDRDRVEALFRELEFGSLLNHLNRLQAPAASPSPQPTISAAPAGINADGQMTMFDLATEVPIVAAAPGQLPPPPFPFVTVRTADALDALVASLQTATAIAFDTETTGVDPLQVALVGISVCCDGETGYYIPVGHTAPLGGLEVDQLPLARVIEALRPSFTDPRIGKYAHNADYDLLVMQQHGLAVTPITFDTQLAEWLRDSSDATLGLKKKTYQEFGVVMTEIKALIGTGKNQITMDQVAIDTASPYAAADAVATYKLVAPLRAALGVVPSVGKQPPVLDPVWGVAIPPPIHVFETVEMPLVPVLAAMETHGITLDVPHLADYSARLSGQLHELQLGIYEAAGGAVFNINSPKQLNDVLFGRLGLSSAGVRKTTHGVSTAADVLETLRGQHPVIEKILEYRELVKLQGTYVDALPRLIMPSSGRVHTRFNQAGASTGRLSSSNPNLQNIPIRTEAGREVRRAFIAPPGWQLISVDYSQVELRIMAHVTGERTLIDAFHNGLDIHATTASLIYGVPLTEVTKPQRNFAKRINFGLLYGMGAFRLARDSDLTLGEANAFVETYFARLPGVKGYIEGTKQIARDYGVLSTLFGRRRRFTGITDANRNTRGSAEREAINMPIQGTAADIIKRAMIDLHAALPGAFPQARLLLQVHDELVLEAPVDQAADVARLTASLMERAASLRVPLVCNASVGDNWRDMTPVV